MKERRMTEEADARWPLDRLVEVCRETPERLRWYADTGLLTRDSPDMFAPDSMHRVRLIQHAHRRGITDEDLAVAVKEQGDLLGVFEELGADTVTGSTMGAATDGL